MRMCRHELQGSSTSMQGHVCPHMARAVHYNITILQASIHRHAHPNPAINGSAPNSTPGPRHVPRCRCLPTRTPGLPVQDILQQALAAVCASTHGCVCRNAGGHVWVHTCTAVTASRLSAHRQQYYIIFIKGMCIWGNTNMQPSSTSMRHKVCDTTQVCHPIMRQSNCVCMLPQPQLL
jgi:hypothetical protein